MSDHLTEEDLVLRHYAEPGRADATAHLEACADCRARLLALGQSLAAVRLDAPEPAADYETRVWRRLLPRLSAPVAARAVWPRRFVVPAAIAASMLIAFLLGRYLAVAPMPSPSPAIVSAKARERVLLGSVSDHLERSRRVLVEMAGSAGPGPVDIAAEQASAANLVRNSRLYRQSATRAGEDRVADVLDVLERVLVEIANAPTDMRPQELRDLRERIEQSDLLFKVRALQSQVHERTSKRPHARTIS